MHNVTRLVARNKPVNSRAICAGGLIFLLLLPALSLQAGTVDFWFHALSGENEEYLLMKKQVDKFNQSQSAHQVNLIRLPANNYNEEVFARALAGDLPDLLDFDGPYIANYVWMGYLQPLDNLLAKSTMDKLLPSIKAQGTYPADNRLYSVGIFDSGLALWGNKQLLNLAGVRIPESVQDAWDGEEFGMILNKLAKSKNVVYPLDLKLNYGQSEWFTYGFSPLVQSLGGDLINRETWQASGTLNSAASIRALNMLQSWVQQGWVVPAVEGDDRFFDEQDVALAWVGHWMWQAHKEALGDNLVLIPMPRFGDFHVTGMGSWNFGISRHAKNPEGAVQFLEFLLADPQVIEISTGNGAVPATTTALAKSELFATPDSQLYIYGQQLQSIAVNRPFHPAYPTISAAFAKAVNNILKGGDVSKELRRAARAIDADITDSNGYHPFIRH